MSEEKEKQLDLAAIEERFEYLANYFGDDPPQNLLDGFALLAEVKRLREQNKVFFEVLTDEELERVRLYHPGKLKG